MISGAAKEKKDALQKAAQESALRAEFEEKIKKEREASDARLAAIELAALSSAAVVDGRVTWLEQQQARALVVDVEGGEGGEGGEVTAEVTR